MAETKTKLGVGGDNPVVREVTIRHEDADAAPWGLDAKLAVVGTEIPRPDGFEKAAGTARYTADINRPNMAFARALRSPHAHATVKSVDVAAAKKVPGVLFAISLERQRVTFSGAPVAAVCAETPQALDDGLAAVVVVYEVLPHVVDATEALDSGSPRVDPKQDNRSDPSPPRGVSQEDFDRQNEERATRAKTALDGAEAKVSAEYRTSIQTHVALEPHGSVAEFSADGKKLTLWCSTQAVRGARDQAAAIAKLSAADVHVVAEHIGGGFGCKFGLDECDKLAIRFAKETGRPVRSMNDRREEHLSGGFRPSTVQKLTLGGMRDGTLTAITGECYGTGGNHADGGGASNTALYGIPAQSIRRYGAATHQADGRAFRAPNHPPGIFALEGMVDEFAHAIGKDPLEVRRLNDKHPIRRLEWPIGAKRIDWAKNRRKVPGSDAGPVKRGVGCAGGLWYNAGGGDWRVDVVVTRDGGVTVQSAVQDIGTGTRVVLATLVAEELGIAPGAVRVEIGDTRFPPGPPSGGSQTAPSVGPAAREAGLRAKEAIAVLVAKEWGLDAEASAKVRFEGGRVVGPEGKETTFAKACSLLPADGLSVSGTRRRNYDGFDDQCAGVQFAQVAVDVETGVVRVEKVVAVHDAGRIVDTMTARSQVNGGVIQGVGYALFEEKLLDRASGDMVNPTYDTYRLCGMADCPEIDVVFMDVANGKNNVGMMGLGEPATVPTAGAVANAVYNAIGVRVRELPITPARVLAALAGAKPQPNGGVK